MLHFDPMEILLTLPGIIIGFVFHEFAHAYAAVKLGDSTPKDQGRLTVDPLPHLDVFGLILIVITGFGWARPVQVDRRNFKNPRRDDIMVSLTGPMINLAIAFFFAILLKLFIVAGLPYRMNETIASGITAIAQHTVRINLVLFIFNLLPIHPLDGFHILSNMVHYTNLNRLYRLKYFSRFILIAIIITPTASYIITPLVDSIYKGLFTLLAL
ncbi:site-2 protease family protein [Petroclostridium sp. X23]|uniref:site-2 protease family protein n=1 Tax=Petroclostridium sp. X23 TaxID=3045146 RepID=UPI0024AD4508|nr:site-2 protease family protein [Petroclostridium sp. X23]WHH61183.1 site-2 protease family protein [Petroclostridium sp. X23]